MSSPNPNPFEKIPLKVIINKPIKGELEIEIGSINVVSGRRYKTYLLESIYSAFTCMGWDSDTDIRVEYVFAYVNIQNNLCMKHNALPFDVILFPEDFVNDEKIMDLVYKFEKGIRYENYGVKLPESFERLYYNQEENMLYVKTQGEWDYVQFDIASTSEKKIAVLSTLAESGLLGDPHTTVLLFDEPNASLHPQDELKLVYTLALLAEKGYTIVVTTDDTDMIMMLSCIDAIPKLLGQKAFEKPILNPTLNLIIDKEIQHYDIRSSATPTYTNIFLDILKNCPG